MLNYKFISAKTPESIVMEKCFVCVDLGCFEMGIASLLGPPFATEKEAIDFCRKRRFPLACVKTIDMTTINIDYLHKQQKGTPCLN